MGKYMAEVKGEQEMRYLLLEKDIEGRDSLELISKFEIMNFLRSSYAENVVKEIWRSAYATNDSIFTASTNFYLMFEYFDCAQDEEFNKRFDKGKSIKNIESHPMMFTVWRFSGKSRIIVEFFNTLFITLVVHVLLRDALNMDADIKMRVN